MYSELTQQLNRLELESLTDSLEVAVSTHLSWLSNVNKALVCKNANLLHLCPEGDSHKHCQFGRWYYSVSNKTLSDDFMFKRLGALHKSMHSKVFELINLLNDNQGVSPECYQEFIAIQSDFFDVLLTLAKESSESLGNIDFLTGLPNRRAFQHSLVMESNRIKRSNLTSTIVLADIDHFKNVNDTYGHDVGDKILVQVASIFRASLREYDTVSRFGGEEFVFCLPEIKPSDANNVIERIRYNVEQEKFDIEDSEEKIHLTCSFGVSQFTNDFAPEEALSSADESLYQAKESGRNMIVNHEVMNSFDMVMANSMKM